MDKAEIIRFFDAAAAQWDADMIRNDEIIATILDNAGVSEGKTVLDVACGTGVLIPDYLSRKVDSVLGVDISAEMVKIAREKHQQKNVQFLCADIEAVDLRQQFDCIVVYNAFPHFPDPQNLIHTLASMLKPGGILTVAHGMSRAAIDRHHSGPASKISMGLMNEKELSKLFESELAVTTVISNDTMYQVAGQRI